MLSLEILAKAVDMVETLDKQKLQSHDTETKKLSSECVMESKHLDGHESDGNIENGSMGNNRPHDHATQNGSRHEASQEIPGAKSTKTVKNHDRKGPKDEILKSSKEDSADSFSSVELSEPERHFLYQQRLAEQANGIQVQAHGERFKRTEENPAASHSPQRHLTAQRRPASPAAVESGDTVFATKPMVLLQQPSAATVSSVGSAHSVPLTNPGLHASTMHHPYLYSLMYPPGVATLDPALSAMGRVPGSVLKDGEGQTSSPNSSPNASLAAAAAGLHLPAGLMYPFPNQALLMGARPPGAVAADMSPMLLAQTTPYPMLDQYKRFFEGMQLPAAYSLQPQLADQYLKSLAHGLDGNKDAIALSAMARRQQPGLSLAALQGQPGVAEPWLRYAEPLSAAMGMLRPQDGLSPRAGSPYGAVKRRTDSPVVANSGKIPTSMHPYHGGIAQPPLNSLSEARSPATSMFSQNHRSRSPGAEARKPEVERSGYRSHSRDLDREAKGTPKELLATTSTTSSHMRTSNEHLVARPYSVTDPQTGRKISIPSSYYEHSSHVPPVYPMGLPVRQPAAQIRSPSPRARLGDDRSHSRPSRDKSPVDVHAKRRSLDSQYVARNSPILHDRHNSRPTSPATNGALVSRPQFPLDNGSAEAAAVAAEVAKANQYLLLASNHARSPNANVYSAERRESKSGSPTANPSYLAAGMSPYFASPILGSLAGASQLMLPQLPQLAQVLAAQAKGIDLAPLYKPGENTSEYARVAGWPSSLSLLSHQQQQLFAAGRSHVMPQDYAAVLKARSPYFPSQPGAKDGSSAGLANGRNKIHDLPQQLHQSLLSQHPPQAPSPEKAGPRLKYSPGAQQLAKQGHHTRAGDSHSPTGVLNGAMSSASVRRYQSPHVDRQPARDVSPKPSTKPFRPNSMLRHHAEDLERSRKRKLMEEERAMSEDGFAPDKHHLPPRPDQREHATKDARKDPKRRKQLVSEADPEDHFRRSLGNDYESTTTNKVHISGSVDDHFEKSLGLMYQNYQAAAPKMEGKGTSSRAPPSYSATVASVTQSPRPYPPQHRSDDGKELTPSTRSYDPEYLARECYYMSNLPSHHRRPAEKSPPRAGPLAAPTVLYPANTPIGPVRQKVKAKAYIPEAAIAAASDLTNNRSVRAGSLGSKGSSRSISGSSVESLPAAVTKSPTASSISSVPPEAVQRPIIPRAIVTTPHAFVHQQGAASTAASHAASSVTSADGSSTPQRNRGSPSSPQRIAAPDESSTQNQISSPPGQKERSHSGEGKQST